MLHNLKHNKVLHQRIVFLTISNEDVPHIPDPIAPKCSVIERGHVYQVTLRYGFMETPDVPTRAEAAGAPRHQFEPLETTFFLGKATSPAGQTGSVHLAPRVVPLDATQ